MDDAMVVALFRHGITEENKRQAYIGWTDAPICEDAGKILASKRFQPSPYEWLVTSDLKRCVQTAQLLFPDQKKVAMPELREMNFGLWEGKTYGELMGDALYDEWVNSRCATEIPGGENSQRFNERIEEGWKKIYHIVLEKNVNSVAIVTHGGVMRYLLSKLSQEKRNFWEWKVPHGNGFELVWKNKESFRSGERCTLLRAVPLTENQVG